MKRICGILLAVITLFACGEEKKTDASASMSEKKDSVLYSYSEATLLFMKKFPEAIFPYTVDTTVLKTIDKNDSLAGTDLALLMEKMSKDDALTSEGESDRSTFLTIDELKQKGKYNAWAAKRDIGETKYANAYVLHNLHLNDTTDVLTWAITHATYEACPYASGVQVYATVFYKGKPSYAMLIAQQLDAGDPPVGMSRTVTSTLEEKNGIGKLSIHEKEISTDEGEDGEPVEEKTENDREYFIVSGNVKRK